LVAGAVPPGGFLSANGNCQYSSTSNDYHVYSIPWQADSYNLTDYIGQTLTVKFTAAGCTLGGHFGIGYFDAKCGPAEITTSNNAPCAGQSVVLTAPPSASNQYSWSGPGIVGANNTQNITVNASGTYTVTVGSGACAYPLSIVMAFNPAVVATASPMTICSGQSSTLTASGATAYEWMPGSVPNASFVVTPATTTTYTVTGTTGGCSQTATVTVSVNATPVVTASASPAVLCAGGSSTLTAGGATSYNWSGLGTSNPINVTPTGTTIYTVTGTNASGCSASNTTTVTVNPLPNAVMSAFTPALCFGTNTGTATITASGGTAPYSYNWSNGANTSVVNGLAAGNYFVTVTDNSGCTATSAIAINQPALLISSVSASTNVSCFGGNNGSATVTANGGSTPYAYNWSNGANTAINSSLTAGSYTVTITDNNGCTSSAWAVIAQPSLLTSVISSSNNVSCFGGNNGSATVTVNGGTPPYAYLWSNAAVTSTISNLTAGNYSVTVTDNHGCTTTTSVSITQSSQLTSAIAASTNVSCFGGNNGTASVSANGGSLPYSYHWSNGSIASGINNLSAGTYTATVTDNNGCTATSSVIITQPPVLTTVVSPFTNVSCFSGNDGTATATVTGGLAPYYYNWSNGANTAVVNNLVAGNYSVTVTDFFGCSATASVVISQPTLLGSNVATSTNVSCFGGNDGTATVVASGGAAPYAYSWSNGDNTSMVTGLPAGNYILVITDDNECISSTSVTITQPALLTSTISSSGQVSCFGGNNGMATVTANAGSAPYTYHWSNGATTPVINGLGAGNYSVSVTDINGCVSTANINITQPALLTSGISASTNIPCYGGNNGSASVTATGGTAPFSYSWSNGANTPAIYSLTAGNYSVTVSDFQGCSATTSVAITQPAQLTSSVSSSNNVSCFGGNNGSATILVAGGTAPYSYNWSNGANTATISNLAAGNYSVIVTDFNGCFVVNSIIITQPAFMSTAVSSSTPVSCYGGSNGSAMAAANGGTLPYTYNWSNGANTANVNGLSAGIYTVTATDFHGCSALASVVITQPTQLTSGITASNNASCFGSGNGMATVSANGGTQPYTYSWSNGYNTPTITGLTAGNYTVSVTDNKGCISTSSVVITQPAYLNAGNPSYSNVSCFGGNDGTASVAAVGGTTPYFYNWSNGSNSSSATGLSIGMYTVTVTDNNGCSATTVTVITQPTLLTSATSAASSVSCFGGNNGMALVTANGGSAPYTYNWSNSANTVINSGLTAGTYTVTTTDYNGCTSMASVVINQPALITIGVTSQTNVFCAGGNNGAATITASGGIVPYSYNWSNGANTAHISGLTAGSYTVTVTDNNGCVATNTIIITETTPLVPNFAAIPAFCYGATAPILGNTSPNGVIGSWSPATVSNTTSGTYVFTPSAGQCATTQSMNIIVNPQITPNIINVPPLCSGSTAPPLTMPPGLTGWWNPATINNTQSGSYTFTPDPGQCAVPQTLSVVIISQVIPNFAPIQPFCAHATPPVLANISPNGVTGYWTPSTVSNTVSATYTFTPNFWECATTQTLNVTVIPQVVPNFASIQPFCEGSNAPVLLPTSPNGISGTWVPAVVSNTQSGIYTFTPDAGQCATNKNLNVVVNPIPDIYTSAFPATICSGSNSILTATGASSYLWMPVNMIGSSISVSPTTASVYTVTGTSAAGCSAQATVTVSIAPDVPIFFTSFPKEGCAPLHVDFNWISNGMIDSTTLIWNFGDPLTTLDHSNLPSPDYTYYNQGNYVVSLNALSIYGCPATWYDTVTAWPTPVAAFTNNPPIGQTDNPLIYFFDQSIGASIWEWNFGDPTTGVDDFSSLQFPTHYYSDSGAHSVQLIVANEYGCTDTAVKVVDIIESFAFWLPSAFTPNGNGINEGFRGEGVGVDESNFEMYIFDRWGKEMFKTRDFHEFWNGTNAKNSKACELGVYVYLINLKDLSGNDHNYTGSVMLIR
ncbi:MAG: gliding motility-associated C-terminal domain-containing protein, partial [Bacteroidota bacterium]